MMEILQKVFDEINTILERWGKKLGGEDDDEDALTCYSVEAGLGGDHLSEDRLSLLMDGYKMLLEHSHKL